MLQRLFHQIIRSHNRCHISLGCMLVLLFVSNVSTHCQNCFGGHCDTKEVCTNGCINGYTDKYCHTKCQFTCKNFSCRLNKNTGTKECTDGCVEGYCGSQCLIPCQQGCVRCNQKTCKNCTQCRSDLFGNDCEHSCFRQCLGFACDIDGKCLDSCVDGWYGSYCNLTCRPEYGSCERKLGTCTKCKEGYYGVSCERICPSCLPAAEKSEYSCKSSCKTCQVMPVFQIEKQDSDQKLDTLIIGSLFASSVLVLISCISVITMVCLRTRKTFSPRASREKKEKQQTTISWMDMDSPFLSLNSEKVEHTIASMEKEDTDFAETALNSEKVEHTIASMEEDTDFAETGSSLPTKMLC